MLLFTALNWHTLFFLIFALFACFFAFCVLVTSNIVRMAFYLTLALGATAGLFMLAGAHFVGAMQLMIYVGGTLVLLVFGVMLTAQDGFLQMSTRGGDWVLAVAVGVSLLALLVVAAIYLPQGEFHADAQAKIPADVANQTTSLGLALLSTRPDKLVATNETLAAGMSGYLLPFEIVSVHLLVVLIGAAYLARARRHAPPPS